MVDAHRDDAPPPPPPPRECWQSLQAGLALIKHVVSCIGPQRQSTSTKIPTINTYVYIIYTYDNFLK